VCGTAIVAFVTEPSSPTPFERLEADWSEVHAAFDARVTAIHRGLPFDEDDYPARRRAFGRDLAAFDATGLSEEEEAGLACIRSALTSYDEWDPVEGLIVEGSSGPVDSPVIAALRQATFDAYGEAAASIDVRGTTIDRLTAFTRLAIADDPAERRAVFEAMAPLWHAVDGDGGITSPYPRLVAAAAERWARDGSSIEANAAVLGIGPGAFEPMLHAILALGRQVLADAAGIRPGGRVEPWDYRYIVGGAERALRAAIPVDRLRPINDAHLRSLGADPDELRIGYDIVPRAGRPLIPVAFTIGGQPGPWVFATYVEGGLGALAELVHESGHALHYAAIRTRPAFAEPPDDHAAFFEAIAELLGWDVGEPVFQERHLGVAVEPHVAALDRYGGVLLDACWALFEIELYRSPGRRPNDVWAEVVADGLGIEPHPEWSWWAVRGQLIDSPGYLANYPLAAIAAAALRARIRELRGDWSTGDPGWYAFVSERLLRFGGSRTPADLIADVLGGPLTAEPVLDDLRRAG
jgi:hypothetical protein